MNLNDIRQEYLQDELTIDSLQDEPIKQLHKWFNQALKSEISYVNSASLATVDQHGVPSNRIILIKDITENGITFFTDYQSDKAQAIESNPNVCLNIFWKEFDRQVRMVGTAKKISFEENQKYFQSRPKESQISATASIQSAQTTKEDLYRAVDLLASEYQLQDVLPCPQTWGGYEVTLTEFEFWQGRPNRLHDRFKYLKDEDGTSWIIKRVGP